MTSIAPCPTASDMFSLLQHQNLVVPGASSSSLLLPLHPTPDLDGHRPWRAACPVQDKAYPPSAPTPPYTPAQHRRSNRSLPDMTLASPWPPRQCPPVVKRDAPPRPLNSSTRQPSTVTTLFIIILLLTRPPFLPQRGRSQRAGSQSGGRDPLLPSHVPPFLVHITYPTPRRW